MNIELSPETETLILQELEHGDYHSPSELVDDAIHQLISVKRDDRRYACSVLPESLIGVFDSRDESHNDERRDAFAEFVADKLQTQGITVPWRR